MDRASIKIIALDLSKRRAIGLKIKEDSEMNSVSESSFHIILTGLVFLQGVWLLSRLLLQAPLLYQQRFQNHLR
jgi:hypothetical protein